MIACLRGYVVAILVSMVLACVAPLQASRNARPYVFGLNTGMSDRECQMAKDAGCTCMRIGCGWDLVETKPGVYDFSAPDADVAQCAKYGFEPFFLIVATPPFYLKEKMRDKPWGWPALPEYYPQAAEFYRTLAARYKGKVKYYEFWNEENGFGWHDTNKPEEYAPILKVAYRALKQGNPNCVVSIGGLDGAGWKGYYHYLEKLYDLGCGSFFDAVTVHPYRCDGPIDVYGLKKIHQVLVKHGHGDRKVWITEYGWDKTYGHQNKAKWLKESLDLLTSPDLDFVFQASVHTMCDFDESEYGLCDGKANPRPAFEVFRNYPKDWREIEKAREGRRPPTTVYGDDFEQGSVSWTRYGDGLRLRAPGDAGIRPEGGGRLLAAVSSDRPLSGGVHRTLTVALGVPLYLEARVYTEQHGSSASNSRARVGIDPAGGTDPLSSAIAWGRWMSTSGEWDTACVGRGDPVVPAGDKITLFLEYAHSGGTVGQASAFDEVRVVRCQ